MSLPDTYWVMEDVQGERRQRFDDLFASYGPDVVAYCGWRAATPSDAEDAVTDVFLTAWRRLDVLAADDSARVWLYATARRVIANQRRSRRRRDALQERLASELPARQALTSDEPDATLVRDALRRLRPRDREVLLLAEWEGLSPAQIAGVLGCLTVTARGRLHQARKRFRSAFDELRAAEHRGATTGSATQRRMRHEHA